MPFTNEWRFVDRHTVVVIVNRKGWRFEILIDSGDVRRLIDNDQAMQVTRPAKTRFETRYATLDHVLLHRWLLNYDGPLVVMHKNDLGLDNRKHNLRIGTPLENTLDSMAKGRFKWPKGSTLPGESNPAAKLTESDVRRICRLHAKGMTQKAIGERFGISKSQINRIVSRENWTQVTQNESLPERRRKITRADVEAMRCLRAKGMTLKCIAKKFGMTPSNVWCIVQGKTWRN